MPKSGTKNTQINSGDSARTEEDSVSRGHQKQRKKTGCVVRFSDYDVPPTFTLRQE
jgi:hypothetical protein